MSDKDNSIDFESAKGGRKPEHKNKKKKNIGWWIGVIILILISITFVLPMVNFSAIGQSQTEFGSWDGEPITYANGTYMANQYANYYYQYGSYYDSTSLLYQAYSDAVVNAATTSMAESVGYKTSEEVVNRAILESGQYSDENGDFDAAAYEATSEADRRFFYQYVENTLPQMQVAGDIASVRSSDAENAFVGNLAGTGRTFEYVAFDASTYPADLCAEYALSNPQPFTQMSVSMLSADTQEEAQGYLDTLASDPSQWDALVEETASAGSLGQMFFTDFSDLGEENANVLFSTAAGSFAGPWQEGSGWVVYRVDSAPALGDFTTDAEVAAIRDYIAANNPEVVTDYAAEAADIFHAVAAEDFDAAVSQYGLTVQNVTQTVPTTGNSSILTGFAYTDTYGLMSDATAADEAYLEALFDAEDGAVMPPQAAGSNYIVARVGSWNTDSSQVDLGSAFYTYMGSSIAQSDLQNAIFSSDRLEDNFYDVLFSNLLADQG